RDHRGRACGSATPTEVLRRLLPSLDTVDVCPYRGLESFGSEHSGWFHGRGDAVAKILADLRLNSRGVLLLGPSGAGKSSVVAAGVLPALAAGKLPGS